MKQLKFTLSFLVFCLIIGAAAAQGTSQKAASGQQKVIRINPVKVDTTDPNRKALNKFSKEKMYNVTTPKQPLKPEEVRALGFMSDGAKKGKAGDYTGAIEDFTKSLDLQKSAAVYAKRAYAYLMVGNYGASISDANAATKLQNQFAQAYFIRGVSYYETGMYKEAKLDLDVFLDHDRTNPIAFNYMAAIAFQEQDYKKAMENYNEVVRLDPKYPDIFTNRGMMRHYNQDFKGAIQDYNEALKLDPNNPTAYNNRGAAKMMMKDLDAALADFSKAITLNDKYADAYDNRGRARHAKGDTQGACADWQKAYSNGLAASMDLIVKFCK